MMRLLLQVHVLGLVLGLALVVMGPGLEPWVPNVTSAGRPADDGRWATMRVANGDCRWRLDGWAVSCAVAEQPCPADLPSYRECQTAVARTRCAPVLHPHVVSGGSHARGTMRCWLVNGMRTTVACRCEQSLFDYCLGPCQPTGAVVDVVPCPGRFVVLRTCPETPSRS